MYFLIYGSFAALITFFLLSFEGIKDNSSRLSAAGLTFALFGLCGWLFMPVFRWNFSGNWFLLTLLGVVIMLVLLWPRAGQASKSLLRTGAIPVIAGLFMLLLVQPLSTWSLFYAKSYHKLLGVPIVSVFDADVSPVAIDRVRRVDQELAYNLGSKRIEEQPGLGSRVALGSMNIQTLNDCFGVQDGSGAKHTLCFENELVWVGPLVHTGFFKWFTNHTTPGYVLVSATDPTKVYLVTAIDSEQTDADSDAVGDLDTSQAASGLAPLKLRYLDAGGYWGDYLVRHVRSNGYASDGLTDYSFEIDNAGRPFWVITRYEPTIGFSGGDTRGVLVVDVQSGEINHYTVADTPEWIDRIQPEQLVNTQLNYWGAYIHGFWNALFSKRDVVQTTSGLSLVYGADGRPYWYSGIQSAGSDTGTNSFVLVDARTKEVRRYMIAGANETAARKSAENSPGVREAGFKGTNPILYNISTEPTYFLTLKGDDGLVKMFAFVSVRNYETVGVGRSVPAALRDYQNALIREGKGIDLQDSATQTRIEAVVTGVVQVGDTFYLLLDGWDGVEFYGTNDVSPELKWARPGQIVTVIVQQGELQSMQLYAFDIPSLTISGLSDNGSR